MVIKTSAAREVARLVAHLSSGDEVAREAAVARLTILGTRAVERLLATWGAGPSPDARVAILRALEAIGDRRGLAPARAALRQADTEVPVALAAIGLLRGHLNVWRAEDADDAFELLAAIALDRGRDTRIRAAAIDALEDLPASTRRAVREGLAADPDPLVRARAGGGAPPAPDRSAAALEQAAEGRLPDSPDRLRALVAAHAVSAPLPTLHRLVERTRAREAAERGAVRVEWLVARAAVHQALAARQSTVALYDLRETLAASRDPLPVGFLAALSQIGDASCLEPIAAAFTNSIHVQPDWWRQRLISTFREIVRRNRLSRRHAVMRRLAERWPKAASQLLPPRR
jgi:hypothetical protein